MMRLPLLNEHTMMVEGLQHTCAVLYVILSHKNEKIRKKESTNWQSDKKEINKPGCLLWSGIQ